MPERDGSMVNAIVACLTDDGRRTGGLDRRTRSGGSPPAEAGTVPVG